MKKNIQELNISQGHFNFSKPKQFRQKGFTLLETLVAIFILTLSITGPVYIASVAFHNTIDSRDNISAQYIAEEVVEVIRNKRDKYILKNSDNGWIGTITKGSDGNPVDCKNASGNIQNKCVMKKNNSEYIFESCGIDKCPYISFDPTGSGAVYGNASADILTVSKFTREFYFETYTTPNDGEVKLVVNINWEDKGRPKTYSLTERLYSVNYKEHFKPDSSIVN